jgi:hypothetical protein
MTSRAVSLASVLEAPNAMSVLTLETEKPASAVKLELDRLELVECVPELQRRSVRDLPRHPLVVRYVNECAVLFREKTTSLRNARRLFDRAAINYKNRCAFRLQDGIEWVSGSEFRSFISLSAIIEARAEALHWNKVIVGLETAAKIEQQQRWNDARLHVTPI